MEKLTLYGIGISIAGIAIVLARSSVTGNVTGPAGQAITAFELIGTLLAVAGLGLIAVSYLWKPK